MDIATDNAADVKEEVQAIVEDVTTEAVGAVEIESVKVEEVVKKEVESFTAAVKSETMKLPDSIDSPMKNLGDAFGSPGHTSPAPSTPPPSKTLNFGTEQVTPVTPTLKSDEPDYTQFIKDTLLWSNKIRSIVYLVGGLLAIYVLSLLASLESSFIANIMFLVLASLAFNFTRNLVTHNTKPRAIYVGSQVCGYVVSRFSKIIEALAELHDKNAAGTDPIKSLKVVAVLWAVSICARLFGAFPLFYAVLITAFIGPVVYTLKKADFDKLLTSGYKQASDALAGLDIKVRLGIFTLPLLLTTFISMPDAAVALLALALYGSSLLKPADVDMIQSKATPIIANATKSLAYFGSTAEKMVVKYDLTPTPKKSKRA